MREPAGIPCSAEAHSMKVLARELRGVMRVHTLLALYTSAV